MNSNIKIVSLMVLSVTVGAIGSFLLFNSGDLEDSSVEKPIPGTKIIKTISDGSRKTTKRVMLVERNGKKIVKIDESVQIRPTSGQVAAKPKNAADDVDEEDLTEKQKSVLKELQQALDDNNLKQVRKALSKFLAKVDEGGLGGDTPACMRAKAVEALGWFGKDAAVDLIAFIADSNEDVASDAFTQFEQALSDSEMGDMARSQLLTATLTALNDSDQIDSLLNQFNDMRNSVKAKTAKEILVTGTEAAKTKLIEQLDTYFDDGVVNAEGIDKWQAMNPDDPDDNETYGGSK